MSLKFISKENLEEYKQKTCFLRVDLNIKKGSEEESFRVDAIIPTLKLLSDMGIKTVIASHRGRFNEETPTLKPFADILSKRIGKTVEFVGNDYDQIEKSEAKFFLIENLRQNRGEEENSKEFAKDLSNLADFYVQDGFAVCHRKNASVYELPKLLPSFGGLLLEKEISNLIKALEEYKNPFTVVIGGAKTRTKVGVLDNLWNKADNFLLGGGIANTFFYAQGRDIGDSIYDKESVDDIEKYLDSEKINLPVDVKKDNNQILDIGKKTSKDFSNIIKNSKTIIWNGPLGYFEKPEFAVGSEAIAKAIAELDSFSVIGGGETSNLISEMGIIDDFSFVSTGGGAMLEFLSGNKLPGIEVLK